MSLIDVTGFALNGYLMGFPQSTNSPPSYTHHCDRVVRLKLQNRNATNSRVSLSMEDYFTGISQADPIAT